MYLGDFRYDIFFLTIVCAGMPGAIVGGITTWRRRRHLYGFIFGWISGLCGALIGLLLFSYTEPSLPHHHDLLRPVGPDKLLEEYFSALRIDCALLGSAVLGWLSGCLVSRRRKGNNVKLTNTGKFPIVCGIFRKPAANPYLVVKMRRILHAIINRLPREQRISLMLDIWDTNFAESGKPLLTDVQRRELERRIAEDNANPNDVVLWEQVKAQTLSQLKPNGGNS